MYRSLWFQLKMGVQHSESPIRSQSHFTQVSPTLPLKKYQCRASRTLFGSVLCGWNVDIYNPHSLDEFENQCSNASAH